MFVDAASADGKYVFSVCLLAGSNAQIAKNAAMRATLVGYKDGDDKRRHGLHNVSMARFAAFCSADFLLLAEAVARTLP